MFSFLKGFTDTFSAFGLLFQPGIRRFVILPFVVNLVLFYFGSMWLFAELEGWLQGLMPDWLAWLSWLVEFLFAIALAIVMYYSFTVVANLIASPFNSLLSARIEAKLTGQRPEDINSDGLFKLMARTTASEIKKILYAVKWFVPLLIITLIPGVNIIAPFCWILFAAWFFALEYTDYPLANRGLFFDEVKQYNREHRMRALGMGSAVFIMTSIPVLNFFAMPVAVAGATRMLTRTGLPQSGDQPDKQALRKDRP